MDRARAALARRRSALYLLGGLPLVFLLLFFVYPLLTLFIVAFQPEGQPDLSSFWTLVTSAYYRETAWFTLWQAALSTALTIGLALPCAFVFARYSFPGKGLLLSLSTLPFVLPTVVVAAAFSALVGPRGLLNQVLISLFRLETAPIQLEQTLTLVLIAHVFYNFPIALRLISGYLANQSPRVDEAARVLGAASWAVWWRVRLPLLRPALFASALLIFIFTFTSFGVVLLLGGPRYATLEVEIYRQATSLLNLPMAAALSIVQIGFMLVLMVVYTRLQRGQTADLSTSRVVARRPRTTRERLTVLITILFTAVLLFVPLIALVARAFTTSDGFGFDYFTLLNRNPRGSVLAVPPAEALGNSLQYAGATVMFALVLGISAAYLIARTPRRASLLLDALLMLPLATSAVTLGFSFILALDEPPLNLRTSIIIIPVAHTLVALPFVVRSVLPALRAIPPRVREAAQVLGAAPLAVFQRVEVPIIARAVVVGATFAFTVSMGEFGATAFLARPDAPTIPIVIARLLGQPGATNYGQALAMSAILLAVCAVGFLLIERARTLGIGEF